MAAAVVPAMTGAAAAASVHWLDDEAEGYHGDASTVSIVRCLATQTFLHVILLESQHKRAVDLPYYVMLHVLSSTFSCLLQLNVLLNTCNARYLHSTLMIQRETELVIKNSKPI